MGLLTISTRRTALVAWFTILAHGLLAGGWPQQKGHAYLKLYQWWVVADQHFTDSGLKDPNTTNGLFNTTFYGEYGFTDKLTAVVSAPLFSRAYFNNTRSATTGELLIAGEAINSIGDIEAGLRFGLARGDLLSWTGTLTLGIPLGNAAGGSAGTLQTGDGEFNQLIQTDLGAGFTLGGVPAYASGYFGLNNRSDGYSDELRYGFEFGLHLFDQKLWFINRFYGTSSLQNGDRTVGNNVTSIFANNSEHLTYSPELSWNIGTDWGVAASVAVPLSGKIIFAAPAYSVGVFMTVGT